MKKILVIEDAQSLRRDIVEMLSFEGFTVNGAENGLVGVEQAKEFLPDLIICDIMMPALDGYGVLEQLRQYPGTASVPFIFLTARTDRVDVRQGMELGADDYLTKPFSAAELLATVHTRIEKGEKIKEIAHRQLESLRENIILALPHELRTPLNVILGFSDLLMMDYEVMEPVRVGEMARHINNAGLRLYRLVENFLIYANIELLQSSPEQLEKVSQSVVQNPRSIIEYVVMQKAQALSRDTDVDLHLEDVSSLKIGEEYLRKVLEELVDNAVKFSQLGTPIKITGELERNQYVLTVSDQGRGMTPEDVASIGAYMQFERRFYEQQGSGLGLVITKRLAEIFGGTFTVTSRLQEGTSVKIGLLIGEA